MRQPTGETLFDPRVAVAALPAPTYTGASGLVDMALERVADALRPALAPAVLPLPGHGSGAAARV